MRKAEELTHEELVEAIINNEDLDMDENRLTIEQLLQVHERLTAAALYVRDYRRDDFERVCKLNKISKKVIDDNEEMTVSVIQINK